MYDDKILPETSYVNTVHHLTKVDSFSGRIHFCLDPMHSYLVVLLVIISRYVGIGKNVIEFYLHSVKSLL